MIEVRDLAKVFKLSKESKREHSNSKTDNLLTAVDRIRFTCHPGRVFTLLGPNGAGKTTTLRILATMLRPTSGSVTICGHDSVKDSKSARKHLGFLTGDTGLYDRLTPDELVQYYADLYQMSREQFQENRDRLFDLLDIQSYKTRRIGKLSSGMKQKVSIARTMIHDPDVVIFDEPTVGLDVITARAIIDLIRDCRNSGKTVVFSTHIMSEVSLLSDDLAIIHEGRLKYSGSFQAFKASMQSDSLEAEFIRILEEDARCMQS